MKDNLKGANFDLIEIITNLWNGRKIILFGSIVFTVLGVTIAFLAPISYQASSKFIPQSSSALEAPKGIGNLAALAGINLNAGDNSESIPPSLYNSIVNSTPFRLELLGTIVSWDDRIETYEFYLNNRPEGFMSLVKKYIGGLLTSKVESSDFLSSNRDSVGLIKLTEEEFGLMKELEELVSVNIDREEGFVLLSASDRNPEIAAQVTQASIRILQRSIIDYKIRQSQNLLDFTNSQFYQKQSELYALQDSLAKFQEGNQNLSSRLVQNQFLRLESQYEMVNNVYLELASQKAQAELQVQRDTPVFSILNPVMVPIEKSSPSRLLVLVFSVFLGVCLSSAWILLKDPLVEIRSHIRNQV